MQHDELTHQIIAASYAVHNTLGPGFLEKVYENALYIELLNRGISSKQQVGIPVFYRQVQVGDYVADMLVEQCVLIELKAVETTHSKHEAQLVNYLTATGLNIGLLINFGSSVTVKRKYRTFKK
ncbi:GxxExxY protein [Spirosoma utsteinense]|uniref:GxxExxY protein n=1 Tax=Spirosoma utsteinense TaxID=2585773 RepID=A0ABR6WFH3_9BACT|nr:GxxExxY protein [Spirosoma utsteinense]MBC3788613.1 GxxExxY protein [Spirosoma utsteinense]MBC3795287.1 GxxExxY protein [Spirosoma utsteinense]